MSSVLPPISLQTILDNHLTTYWILERYLYPQNFYRGESVTRDYLLDRMRREPDMVREVQLRLQQVLHESHRADLVALLLEQ